MFDESEQITESIESREPEKRIRGKIIKVSAGGWGFISSKDIPYTRVFWHWTSLKQETLKFLDLKNGMKVAFTPVDVEGKGHRAIKIEVIDDNGQLITTKSTKQQDCN